MAGGWKKYFDADLEKAFDDWIEKKTEGFKINFKWQWNKNILLIITLFNLHEIKLCNGDQVREVFNKKKH